MPRWLTGWEVHEEVSLKRTVGWPGDANAARFIDQLQRNFATPM